MPVFRIFIWEVQSGSLSISARSNYYIQMKMWFVSLEYPANATLPHENFTLHITQAEDLIDHYVTEIVTI